jgi:hypothetical protein
LVLQARGQRRSAKMPLRLLKQAAEGGGAVGEALGEEANHEAMKDQSQTGVRLFHALVIAAAINVETTCNCPDLVAANIWPRIHDFLLLSMAGGRCCCNVTIRGGRKKGSGSFVSKFCLVHARSRSDSGD